MRISLRQLAAFLYVAEEASVSRAAQRMGLTQSAVSVLLRELERAIGNVTLLERSPRAVRLTPAGREALSRAQLIVGEADLFIQDFKSLSDLRRGKLKIAAPVAVASSLLPRLIKKFQQLFPDMSVEVHDVDPNELSNTIRRGIAEIGLATIEAKDQDIKVEPIISDRLSMIVPLSSPHAKRTKVTWSDLKEMTTISMRKGNSIRSLIDRSLAAQELTFTPNIEVFHLATALAFTVEGFGCAILPSYLVPHMGIGSFATIPLSKPEITREIVLISSRNHAQSPAAVAFSKLATAEFRAR